MKKLNIEDVKIYVEKNIDSFHIARIESLNNMRLSKILKRKNPYLFKTKNMLNANEIVSSFLDAHISSSEETIFGDWLEGLVIFINSKVYDGYKSGIQGIDLEFDNEGVRYIVSIKSGPNWGNSSQIKKMIADFKTAKKTLRTSNSNLNIVAINGCCYGKERNYDKGDYFKYCGQKFWHFISGNENLYTDIIEPLGYKAKEKNDNFIKLREQMINKFTYEFIEVFCESSGEINWKKIVEFNSKE